MNNFIDNNFGKLIILAVLVLSFMGAWHDIRSCEVYAKVTGLETRYEFGVCYVKQGDRFYPRDELRLRNATKGQ